MPAVIVAAMAALIAQGLTGAYRVSVELAERVLPEHLRLWGEGLVIILRSSSSCRPTGRESRWVSWMLSRSPR